MWGLLLGEMSAQAERAAAHWGGGVPWMQAAWATAEEEQRRVLRVHGPELSIEALGDMQALQASLTGLP